MSRARRTPAAARVDRARRWLAPIGLLIVWQLASSTGLISSRVLAAPATVLEAGWVLLSSGELSSHLWVSLGRVVRGLGLGAGLGLALGRAPPLLPAVASRPALGYRRAP